MTPPQLVTEIGGWAVAVIGLAGLIALAAFVLYLAVEYTIKQLGIFWILLAFYSNRLERKKAEETAVAKGWVRPSDEELTHPL